MQCDREAASIRVLAPAKLNLFFEVLGKRLDGFHEIETLMVPINLSDQLIFQTDLSGRVLLDCHWADGRTSHSVLGTLPPAAENLAMRAVLLLRERAGVSLGASMRLTKRIPAAAGLGGGSSDAAAALRAANLGWRLNWPLERLLPAAAELGSDVPFFLGRGAAVCRGRGEQIEPVGALGGHFAVVVRPPEGLSTAAVYGRCRAPAEPRSAAPLVDALRRGDRRCVARHLCNRLEPAAAELSPWIGRLREEFSRVDCLAAQMSGSGTSYFGICHHAQHARRVAGRLRSRGVGRVFTVCW